MGPNVIPLYFPMFSLEIEVHNIIMGYLKITIPNYCFTVLYFSKYKLFPKILFRKNTIISFTNRIIFKTIIFLKITVIPFGYFSDLYALPGHSIGFNYKT